MDSKKELVEVDESETGLDRSNITHKGQIKLPNLGVSQEDSSKQTEPDTHSSSSVISALKERKHSAAIKIRKSLHISKDSDIVNSQSPVLANSAEQSDSRLLHNLPVPDKHGMKEFIHNPVETVKSKVSDQGNQQVAANIAAKEISHGQEVDLVNAHDAVNRAKTENEKLLAIEDVSRLLRERQSTYARWSLDRHVTKVRLMPRETMELRPRAAFQTKNARGEIVTDWKAYAQHLLIYYAHQYGGQYIGYGSELPAPSKETIMPNIERLIVATSPFQEFIMTTRRVYRWEDRAETSKYLLIYLVLWYLNLLLPGMLSAILYLVIGRRVHSNTIEDLREDIKHREDQQQTALSLNEFIEKRGDEKWADDIVEAVGPWLMVQLADMANFFESIRNFYEWRKPARTMATLGVFAVVILALPFIPVWLLVKSMTLSAGFTFFALFPISVNFSEYRLLVSPTKRILWNIPTQAEWAIKYIQAEGTRVEDNTPHDSNGTAMPSTTPIKKLPKSAQAQDYGSYKAHHDKATGHLIISVASCRFISNTGHDVHWQLPYDQINKIEKQDRIVAKNIPSKLTTDSGKDLRLVTKTGEEYLLKNMQQRDEAFCQILGFSHTTWQIVW